MATLTRYNVGTVTLLSDESRPGGVTFAFTERTGGVSGGTWASLNLGDSCGDCPALVQRNREIALAALSPDARLERLINPKQVHGDTVVRLASQDDGALAEAQAAARAGADAVVVGVPDVPVLLCYADCVPVILVSDGGFAVVHSGWKGTYARICAKAVQALAQVAGADPGAMRAYIGPHILGSEYAVSADLAARFAAEFGPSAVLWGSNVDLGVCIEATLVDAGLSPKRICNPHLSCYSNPERFFSYRASGGTCGRHGALAIMEE